MIVKKTYLFLFTIGPVQSFIAQARKTQDLYAGSKILSELAKVGLIAANPKECIFPNSTSNPSVPNRFLCIIETDNPKDFGLNVVEKAVKQKWNDIAKSVLAHSHVDGIREQIETHLELNWVFQEIKPDYSDYREQYEKIERLLGAVKNARHFAQFDYQLDKKGVKILGEIGRKCSLDGERNVKFYRRTEKEQDAKDGILRNENERSVYANKLFISTNELEVINNTDERLPFLFSKLQVGEGLSAVSMVKRLYKESNKSKDFDSTADIALKHTLDRIKKYQEGNALLDAFKNTHDEVNAQLYYEENHTEQYYKKQGISINDLDKLKNKQKELKKYAESEFGLELTKYYAVIDFDGDNMGKWLGGGKIQNPEKNLKEFHTQLSKQLALFAAQARLIVNKYGQTVYAGGDDFLGFVNLNCLFEAMTLLRGTFKTIVNDELQTLGYLNEELSFSAGVCIAHYKEPLSMVLSKAGKAQKIAKDDKKGKRNAFTIVASKHSGENHEAYYHWGNNCQNIVHWSYIVQQLKTSNCFSNTFIKSINVEFARLTCNKGNLLVSAHVLEAELSRLVARSCMFKRDYTTETGEQFQARKKQGIEDLIENIMALFQDNNFNNFINALNICDFMHRLLSKPPCEEGINEALQTT